MSQAKVLSLFPEMLTPEEKVSSKNFLSDYEKELGKLKCTEVADYCKNYGDQALHNSNKISIGKGNVPVMPVISRHMKSIPDLMNLLKDHKGNSGKNRLNPVFIRNLYVGQHLFYWIYNVNFGKNLKDRSPLGAEDVISRGAKKPLSIEEVITLCIFYPLHLKYQVVALGSVYGDSKQSYVSEVPVVGMRENKLILYSIKRVEDKQGFIYPTKF
ncbi:MAG: hypothetical protein WDZ80_05165 [Candidatus Paceibacterota bacterium]